MGFDICGIEPETTDGEYFRNNVWWWHPLWDYVVATCSDALTDEDCQMGRYNDGHVISADKALKIAERLNELIETAAVAREADSYQKYQESLPEEKCIFCDGIGERNDQYARGVCNACKGKGEMRSILTWHPFNEDNVRRFAEFAHYSGGFAIW